MAPLGTILVDGSLLKRHIYPVLFGIWGTVYNTGGEAADEFRAPDPLGRGLVVKGTNASVNALGLKDAIALANRQGFKHNTANNLTAGSAPSLTNANKIESVTYNKGVGAGTGGGATSVVQTADSSVTTTNGNVSISAGGAPGGSIGANAANLPFDNACFLVCNLLVVAG